MLAGILDIKLKKTKGSGGRDIAEEGSASLRGGSPHASAKGHHVGNRAVRSEALAAARAIPTDVKQAIEDAQVCVCFVRTAP